MQKNAMFLIGEAEYESHKSMPPFINKFKEKYKWKVTTCTSNPIEDGRDFYEFEGMNTLDNVDVLVIYTRFRRLSNRQMIMLLKYIEEGRPIVGLRTSTHSFAFPIGDEYNQYNNNFGTMLFGTPWRYHHGHSSSTSVSIINEKSEHPILKGVEKEFKVRSWLYHVLPLPDSCVPLLMGKAVNSEITDPTLFTDNPVAWTNTYNGGKIFYTSMGHPEDFECPSFCNLVMNGILWAGEK